MRHANRLTLLYARLTSSCRHRMRSNLSSRQERAKLVADAYSPRTSESGGEIWRLLIMAHNPIET